VVALGCVERPSEDEAISSISVAVDLGVTLAVDGNLGVHAVLKKGIFGGIRVELPSLSGAGFAR